HHVRPIPLVPTVITLFFFTDTPPTEIYTLSLHDALPISDGPRACATSSSAPSDAQRDASAGRPSRTLDCGIWRRFPLRISSSARSEEHTSELQSQSNLVCRLLLEKKKKTQTKIAKRQQHI